MKLNYYLKTTPKITQLLQKLEVFRQVIDLLPPLPEIELNLRRQSLLKSSLFSARIEGNELQLHQLNQTRKDNLQKIEVFNILDALNWIYSPHSPQKVNLDLLLKLHQFVLKDIVPVGKFRTKPSAIFNQAGVAIYVTPSPPEIPGLIKRLIKNINDSREPGPVNAALNHFTFEKIHPFMDGNGRVGRLLSVFILKQTGFGFKGLVSLEEYLEKNRSSYYDLLNQPQKDLTEFVEFFLQGLVDQAQKTIKSIKNLNHQSPEDRLLPRRQEILAIIRDHKVVSFNFIQRRFFSVPKRTLHYDLEQLAKKGLIQKLGSTRGALYSAA